MEEHRLIVMDNCTTEEHLPQTFQTSKKQFEIAVTFLTGYNGIFKVTDENNKFCFTKSIENDDFNVLTIPEEAYELESLNDKIKKMNIKETHFKEGNYPFVINLNFSFFS